MINYFSFKTQDTDRPIGIKGSDQGTFKVIMTDNNGRQYIEDDYEGLGVFQGKDYFQLLAEMNGYQTREEGIDLIFFDRERISPSISESGEYFEGAAPEMQNIEVTIF